MEKEDQQELIFKFNMLEQQIQQIRQQLEAIEQAITELNSLYLGLEDLVGSKDKEILAPIGKGIFAKTKLLSEKLIVDIGGKNFVNKTIPDTKKIIKDQIIKLEEARENLEKSMDEINQELTHLMLDAQKKEKN
ncbi:prefoldin subunit alpha [Nanoarchaeota archaeon]